jgi:hypothetical protein
LVELKHDGVCLTEAEAITTDGKAHALKPICSLFCQGSDRAWAPLTRRIAKRGPYDPRQAACHGELRP